MAMDLDPQDEMDVFEELPYEFVLLNYTKRLDTHFQYKAKGCFHRKKKSLPHTVRFSCICQYLDIHKPVKHSVHVY